MVTLKLRKHVSHLSSTYLVLNYSALECGASAISITLDRSRDGLRIKKKRDRERQLQASALALANEKFRSAA